MTREQIREAVARGWCTPENGRKVMDPELALAISEEVYKADNEPNLGFATTGQLLKELTARCEVDGTINYRTVDPH